MLLIFKNKYGVCDTNILNFAENKEKTLDLYNSMWKIYMNWNNDIILYKSFYTELLYFKSITKNNSEEEFSPKNAAWLSNHTLQYSLNNLIYFFSKNYLSFSYLNLYLIFYHYYIFARSLFALKYFTIPLYFRCKQIYSVSHSILLQTKAFPFYVWMS